MIREQLRLLTQKSNRNINRSTYENVEASYDIFNEIFIKEATKTPKKKVVTIVKTKYSSSNNY